MSWSAGVVEEVAPLSVGWLVTTLVVCMTGSLVDFEIPSIFAVCTQLFVDSETKFPVANVSFTGGGDGGGDDGNDDDDDDDGDEDDDTSF